MVRTIKYTTSQIAQLSNIPGKIIYDSTTNLVKFNNSAAYGNFIYQNADGYLSGLTNVAINGNLGVNTNSPNTQLEVNSATGSCLRLTYDDSNGSALYYSDLSVSSAGNLTINSSGNIVNIDSGDSFKVLSHNGTNAGLYLGSTLVLATATELNTLSGVVNGTAAASKALILDASSNIKDINIITSNKLVITDTTASTSSITGAIKSAGGITISNATDATDATNGGGFTNLGGSAVSGKAYFGSSVYLSSSGGILSVANTTESTSYTDASVILNGGMGVAKKAYFNSDVLLTGANGVLNISNETDATGLTDGTIKTLGGASFGKKVFVGTSITVNGSELTKTQIDYLLNFTIGYAVSGKALIFDSNKSIVDVNYIESQEISIIKQNAYNNTVDYPLTITVVPNTTAVNGLGTGITFNSVNDNDEIYNAAYINFVSSDITKGEEAGYFDFKLANIGVIDSLMTLSNNGIVTASEFNELSDIKLKDDIKPYDIFDSLDKITNLNVKSYNLKKDLSKKGRVGLIAQDVHEIIPNLVNKIHKDDNEYMTVNYVGIIPHLINAVKQLKIELDDIKNKK